MCNMLNKGDMQILNPHFRKLHFSNLQPFHGIVHGTPQNMQPFQDRRISRMPKTTTPKTVCVLWYGGVITLSRGLLYFFVIGFTNAVSTLDIYRPSKYPLKWCLPPTVLVRLLFWIFWVVFGGARFI